MTQWSDEEVEAVWTSFEDKDGNVALGDLCKEILQLREQVQQYEKKKNERSTVYPPPRS